MHGKIMYFSLLSLIQTIMCGKTCSFQLPGYASTNNKMYTNILQNPGCGWLSFKLTKVIVFTI